MQALLPSVDDSGACIQQAFGTRIGACRLEKGPTGKAGGGTTGSNTLEGRSEVDAVNGLN